MEEAATDVHLWKFIAAAVVLTSMFLALLFSRLHRAVVVLLAASAVFILHLAPYKLLMSHIDTNVIMLIVAMMIIVSVVKRTGLFQFIAIKSAKLAGGDPLKLLVLFAVVTAVLSSFFDNVTTILLMSPVTLLVCEELGINPAPLLITQAVASNFGGTATLIGDPPNIMIGSAVGLSFTQFILHLAPLVIIVVALYAFLLHIRYREKVGYASAAIRARIASMDEKKAITDKKLLKRCLIVLLLMLVGFALHDTLTLEVGAIALCGAAALLLLSRADIIKLLEELEWTTPLFFICLYIVVGACVEVGLIKRLGDAIFSMTPSSIFFSAMLIMWFSALCSAFVDNVPFTAMMIPMLKNFVAANSIDDASALWWALAIGACFGGNITIIGAAANVVTVGIAEKSGYHITFGRFSRYSAPFTIAALAISSLYLYFRYFL